MPESNDKVDFPNSAMSWRGEEIYRNCLKTIVSLVKSSESSKIPHEVLRAIHDLAETAISLGEKAPTHATRVTEIRRSLMTHPVYTLEWRDSLESLMIAIEGLEFELTGQISEVCAECDGKGFIEGIGDRSVTCENCDGKKFVSVP